MNLDKIKRNPQRKWTKQATFCYCIGGQCSKCNVPKDFQSKCQMKGAVLDLVQYKEKPPEKIIDSLREELSNIGVNPDKFFIED